MATGRVDELVSNGHTQSVEIVSRRSPCRRDSCSQPRRSYSKANAVLLYCMGPCSWKKFSIPSGSWRLFHKRFTGRSFPSANRLAGQNMSKIFVMASILSERICAIDSFTTPVLSVVDDRPIGEFGDLTIAEQKRLFPTWDWLLPT